MKALLTKWECVGVYYALHHKTKKQRNSNLFEYHLCCQSIHIYGKMLDGKPVRSADKSDGCCQYNVRLLSINTLAYPTYILGSQGNNYSILCKAENDGLPWCYFVHWWYRGPSRIEPPMLPEVIALGLKGAHRCLHFSFDICFYFCTVTCCVVDHYWFY